MKTVGKFVFGDGEVKTRFINAIPVLIGPHPLHPEWTNVVCGNSRMNTTRSFDHTPTDEDLKDAVRRHEAFFAE